MDAQFNSETLQQAYVFGAPILKTSIPFVFLNLIAPALKSPPSGFPGSTTSYWYADAAIMLNPSSIKWRHFRLEDQREDCQTKFGCRIEFMDFHMMKDPDKKVFSNLSQKIVENCISEDDFHYFQLQDDTHKVQKTFFDLWSAARYVTGLVIFYQRFNKQQGRSRTWFWPHFSMCFQILIGNYR